MHAMEFVEETLTELHGQLHFEAMNGGEELDDGTSLEGLVPTKDVGMVGLLLVAPAAEPLGPSLTQCCCTCRHVGVT